MKQNNTEEPPHSVSSILLLCGKELAAGLNKMGEECEVRKFPKEELEVADQFEGFLITFQNHAIAIVTDNHIDELNVGHTRFNWGLKRMREEENKS
jgi:hypothetical protein